MASQRTPTQQIELLHDTLSAVAEQMKIAFAIEEGEARAAADYLVAVRRYRETVCATFHLDNSKQSCAA